MKIITKTLLASSLCMLIVVPAHAGRNHDDVRLMSRMERQHQRIDSGVASGALTRKETRKLKKQQHKTRNISRKLRKHDVLSSKKRHILNKRLIKTSDRIWEYKHNNRDRHTDRYAFLDTHRDTNRRRRHNLYDGYYEDDNDIVYSVHDSEAWPRYGFLNW